MKRKLLLCIVLTGVLPLVALLSALLANAVPLLSAPPSAPAAPATCPGGTDDREETTPISNWHVYAHQTHDQVTYVLTNTGSRLVDLVVETTTPSYLFSAVYVGDSGVYCKPGWRWWYNQTAADVAFIITSTNSRIISFKPYELTPGVLRFAAVYVDNSGADHKDWDWWYNVLPADVTSTLNSKNDRPVQLSQYTLSGLTYYALVGIHNTGADYKPWWIYLDAGTASIDTTIAANDARVYDLDRDPATGLYNVVEEGCPCPYWWHWNGMDAAQFAARWTQDGSRVVDVESYPGCGDLCYSAVFVDNSNAVTSRVGHMLRNGLGSGTRDAADGVSVTVGLYLKQVGGPTLAALETDFPYQPASSIKVVEHLYTMRRVQMGTSLLTDSIVHYTDTATSCPDPPHSIGGTEPITTALKNMMRNSDNARTREISDTFGVVNFNFMMTATVGMSSNSQMGEVIGCGVSNRFTLADAGKLYEGVADGSLLSGQTREEFYFLMAGKEQYLETGHDFTSIWSPALDQLISEEHPLGMTTAMTQTYKSMMRLNYKAGGYTFCQNIACDDVREYISVTGLVQIPFCSGSTTTLRQFVFGTFLHGPEDKSWISGKYTLADQTFDATKAEVLREQVRAGLASCFYIFQNFLPLIVR